MRTISTLLCVLFTLLFMWSSDAQSEVQRVRIDFQNPEGYTRHLLLGFVEDNSATDGYDYGYDALNLGNLSGDLNWIIEGDRYVIQGVGAYNSNKYYPFGMFLENSGVVTISLNALENFDSAIDVYLYDLELDTYTLLNTTDYVSNLAADNYLNRFYLTFSDSIGPTINSNNLLSLDDSDTNNLKIWHSNLTNELCFKGLITENDTSISLYTMEGKELIEEKFSYNGSNDILKLNTASISDGLYIVSINSSMFSRTEKICIVHK